MPKASKGLIDWRRLAQDLALHACEDHFPTRRGVWFIEEAGVLCLFNNNPYEGFPTLRDEELAEFRRLLDVEGLRELAYATYPPEGDEDPGYTYAMIIEAGQEKLGWAEDAMGEIVRRSHVMLDERC
ncbi:hypothetical protein [Paludisphaera soli]|uniref:hypothetical protein n=1 Tax=Paludisphaera soli TaxID=2712865 RepID=UPI0013ED626C|nr:hypothetical protein [Paludisphaera soli]